MHKERSTLSINVRRIYDPPSSTDGCRLLIDRLWPRGITKKKAQLDEWLHDLAPSKELRKWFDHRPERWDAFRLRYRRELAEHAEDVARLHMLAETKPMTLLFGARDVAHNNAVVLREVLLHGLDAQKRALSPHVEYRAPKSRFRPKSSRR